MILEGVSGKSQLLLLLVFAARYLDLFTNFISIYNTTLKVFYLASSALTLTLVYGVFWSKGREERRLDTVRVELLIACAGLLAFRFNYNLQLVEVSPIFH